MKNWNVWKPQNLPWKYDTWIHKQTVGEQRENVRYSFLCVGVAALITSTDGAKMIGMSFGGFAFNFETVQFANR